MFTCFKFNKSNLNIHNTRYLFKHYIIDEFAMMDRQIFLIVEQLCRKFTTKDGQFKPWGGRHVILFGDPAQLRTTSVTL